MKRLFFVLLATATMAAQAQSVDVKGIPFGATQEQARQAVLSFATSWTCDKAEANGDVSCLLEGFSYANADAHPSLLKFRSDQLVSATIVTPSRAFPDVVQALTGKYGKPATVSNSTVQNLAGATLQQQVMNWRLKDHTILATRFTDDLTRSAVTLSTKQEAARAAEQARQKSPKRDI